MACIFDRVKKKEVKVFNKESEENFKKENKNHFID